MPGQSHHAPGPGRSPDWSSRVVEVLLEALREERTWAALANLGAGSVCSGLCCCPLESQAEDKVKPCANTAQCQGYTDRAWVWWSRPDLSSLRVLGGVGCSHVLHPITKSLKASLLCSGRKIHLQRDNSSCFLKGQPASSLSAEAAPSCPRARTPAIHGVLPGGSPATHLHLGLQL